MAMAIWFNHDRKGYDMFLHNHLQIHHFIADSPRPILDTLQKNDFLAGERR